MGFASRLSPGFKLNLPSPAPSTSATSAVPAHSPAINGAAGSLFSEGLTEMRSEPSNLPSSRGPPKMSLNLSGLRAASVPGREEATTTAPEDYPMPPPTQRGPPSKPPKLNLVNPASASPAVSTAPTPIMERRLDMPSSRTGSQTATVPLRVELLSTAFVVQDAQRLPQHLPNPEPAGPSDRTIRARCSQQLGVAADQITLYELRKLQEGAPLPDGCHHVGIMVQGNSECLLARHVWHAMWGTRTVSDGLLPACIQRVLRVWPGSTCCDLWPMFAPPGISRTHTALQRPAVGRMRPHAHPSRCMRAPHHPVHTNSLVWTCGLSIMQRSHCRHLKTCCPEGNKASPACQGASLISLRAMGCALWWGQGPFRHWHMQIQSLCIGMISTTAACAGVRANALGSRVCTRGPVAECACFFPIGFAQDSPLLPLVDRWCLQTHSWQEHWTKRKARCWSRRIG